MPYLLLSRRLTGADVGAIGSLLVAVAAAGGEVPGTRPAEGAWGVLARLPGQDRVVGWAGAAQEGRLWNLHHAVDPGLGPAGASLGAELLAGALELVAGEGGGLAERWVSRPGAGDDDLAVAAGLVERRDLYQMRRPLPVGEAWSLTTRPFRPGLDEEAWLTVNNRAFAWHPEQGGWDVATLRAREAEPWFDPDGFLLHDDGGRLAGFCWTKVHAGLDPPLGEIYVIAVDPDWQGTGLGRRLVLAGLAHLAGRGLTVGMLYVDAANHSAVKLYRDLGFEVDHTDRAYSTTVAPT